MACVTAATEAGCRDHTPAVDRATPSCGVLGVEAAAERFQRLPYDRYARDSWDCGAGDGVASRGRVDTV